MRQKVHDRQTNNHTVPPAQTSGDCAVYLLTQTEDKSPHEQISMISIIDVKHKGFPIRLWSRFFPTLFFFLGCNVRPCEEWPSTSSYLCIRVFRNLTFWQMKIITLDQIWSSRTRIIRGRGMTSIQDLKVSKWRNTKIWCEIHENSIAIWVLVMWAAFKMAMNEKSCEDDIMSYRIANVTDFISEHDITHGYELSYSYYWWKNDLLSFRGLT